MKDTVAQLIGSIFILVFACLISTIALVTVHQRLMREALLGSAAYLTTVVCVRMLTFWGAISQTDARILNGLLVIPFIIMLLIPIVSHYAVRKAVEKRDQDSGDGGSLFGGGS